MEACLRYPWSVIAALVFVYLLIMVYVLSDRHAFLKRLSGRTSKIVSLGLIVICTLFQGFAGGVRLVGSWWFVLALLYFETTLGLAVADDFCHFRSRPKGSVLAHLGVFLVLLAGVFGSSDKSKVTMSAYQNETTAVAYDEAGNKVTMPFMLTLKEFILEEYEDMPVPKRYLSIISVADMRKGMRTVEVEVNHPAKVGQWRIYQYNYDLSHGEGHSVSIFKCVKDPWYSLAAPAMWLILLSGLFVFLTAGKRRIKK